MASQGVGTSEMELKNFMEENGLFGALSGVGCLNAIEILALRSVGRSSNSFEPLAQLLARIDKEERRCGSSYSI